MKYKYTALVTDTREYNISGEIEASNEKEAKERITMDLILYQSTIDIKEDELIHSHTDVDSIDLETIKGE